MDFTAPPGSIPMRFWETRRTLVGDPPHPLKTTMVPTAAVWNHDPMCSRRDGVSRRASGVVKGGGMLLRGGGVGVWG